MEVKIEIDQAAKKLMEKTLLEFQRSTGKTVEEGVQMIAMSAGRRLAQTVQPYGLSAAKGQKFERSIGGQVYRAAMNANVTGLSGTAQEVHKQRRNSKGQVPKGLDTRGRFKRDPIAIAEREAHAKKQKAKAGRAKAGWVEAVNDIGNAAMTGVASWISRHVGSGYGSAIKTGSGMNHRVTLHNKTPYLSSLQNDKEVGKAVIYGIKNGMKRMQKIIEKEIEKANRTI